TEYQESRGPPDGRGTGKVDRREHDNRGHDCPSRAVGSRSSTAGPQPRRSSSGHRQGLRGTPQGAVSFRRSWRDSLRRTRITSMIVDTSALIAILLDEPEAASCAHAIENSVVRRVSAANFVEAAVIIDASRDPVASRRFEDLIKEAQIIIEPVTESQARIAREAYRDFGKGSSHPAKLNFGDCFAYALAKFTGEPLLFKGDDFAHTDIK